MSDRLDPEALEAVSKGLDKYWSVYRDGQLSIIRGQAIEKRERWQDIRRGVVIGALGGGLLILAFWIVGKLAQ